jgi:putative ABC transport system permease protein
MYVEISLPRLALSLGLIALSLVLARVQKLGLERSLLLGTVRAAAQLIGIGYLLLAVFDHPAPWLTLGLLAVMLGVAAFTSARRVAHGPGARRLFVHALGAIVLGSGAALLPLFLFIVPVHPWFDARFVVPLAGMMVANAMNVVALTYERVFAGAHAERGVIEQLLSLGATPSQALERLRAMALRAALTPTVNGLLTVGLVALPGMMTGQILAGSPPVQAVRYQLVVMYQLVAVAAVAGTWAARSAQRLLFTPQMTLTEFSARSRVRDDVEKPSRAPRS